MMHFVFIHTKTKEERIVKTDEAITRDLEGEWSNFTLSSSEKIVGFHALVSSAEVLVGL